MRSPAGRIRDFGICAGIAIDVSRRDEEELDGATLHTIDSALQNGLPEPIKGRSRVLSDSFLCTAQFDLAQIVDQV